MTRKLVQVCDGPDLDLQDPQIGDEVPASRAVAVVTIEPKAGGVVDGVSCSTDETGQKFRYEQCVCANSDPSIFISARMIG